MARKRSKKSRPARRNKGKTLSTKLATKRLKNPRRRSGKQEGERVQAFDAANLFRQGKAKSVSNAARMAGTNLNALWRWIPGASEKDPRTGRLRIKASDRYSEKVEIPEINLTLLAHYEMEALGEASTRLNFNVNWMGATLPAENKQGMMAGQAANFELFKHVCETNPA